VILCRMHVDAYFAYAGGENDKREAASHTKKKNRAHAGPVWKDLWGDGWKDGRT